MDVSIEDEDGMSGNTSDGVETAVVDHPRRFPRANVLGTGVSAIGLKDATRAIQQWISSRECVYVTVAPAHAIMDAYQDEQVRRIMNASGLTTPDGMAIVWLLKLRGYSIVSRVYGPDLMLETCRAGLGHEYRRFLYGGAEAVANTLAAISLCAEARTQYLFFLTLLAGPIQSGDGGLQQSP